MDASDRFSQIVTGLLLSAVGLGTGTEVLCSGQFYSATSHQVHSRADAYFWFVICLCYLVGTVGLSYLFKAAVRRPETQSQ